MKLLFLSAYYPPFEIGGWEQLTQELVDRLRSRGHAVGVLTSNFKTTQAPGGEAQITRRMRLENDLYRYHPAHFFIGRPLDIRYNFSLLEGTIRSFQPEAVMIHSMWNLSRAIPWKTEQLLPGKVIYYLADYWPSEPDVNEMFWNEQAGRAGAGGLRKTLARFVMSRLAHEKEKRRLRFQKTIFVSRAVQKHFEMAGYPWARQGCVIHNGIDISQFSPGEGAGSEEKHLLFVGSFAHHKGLQILIDAMALLVQEGKEDMPLLRVAGGGHQAHLKAITDQIDRLGLDERVQLLGRVERSAMPALYRKAYALVFPSVWPEPLARTTQEAMACGLPVIATLTGGTGELVSDEVNGLAFKPENPAQLAAQIKRLWNDRELAERLRKAARQTIVEQYDIDQTVARIEEYLLREGERQA